MSVTSTEGVEKGAIDSAEKCQNRESITSIQSKSARSNNCFRKLLDAPCGESPKFVSYVTTVLSGLVAWALLFSLLEHEVKPGGQLFLLIVLTLLSYCCGWVASLVHLPPLLGMLLCGIALRNYELFKVSGLYVDIVTTIREIALTTILLKAGLGLDAGALKKLSFVVARLAFTPCLAETVGAALAAHYLLSMPWLWGLLLGAVLSAVSPAVVVPTLLSLKEKGYGESKGISTLVIAASSIDDIISISMFGVILGMLFAQDKLSDLTQKLMHAPIEVGLGLLLGIGWGIVVACFPHRNEDYLVVKRSFMVGGGGLVAVLLSSHYKYAGSGPLAAIVLSFIGQLCWKWQGWSKSYNPVADVFNSAWSIMQPLLFGLIGTEIDLKTIDMSLIWQGLGVLLFGLFVRVIACCLVLIGANLNMKEVVFVNLAWLPKATVQATLGPIALDMANRLGMMEETKKHASNILTIAVLSILITAPIGAIGISVGGPRLLDNQPVIKKSRYAASCANKTTDATAVVKDQL